MPNQFWTQEQHLYFLHDSIWFIWFNAIFVCQICHVNCETENWKKNYLKKIINLIVISKSTVSISIVYESTVSQGTVILSAISEWTGSVYIVVVNAIIESTHYQCTYCQLKLCQSAVSQSNVIGTAISESTGSVNIVGVCIVVAISEGFN